MFNLVSNQTQHSLQSNSQQSRPAHRRASRIAGLMALGLAANVGIAQGAHQTQALRGASVLPQARRLENLNTTNALLSEIKEELESIEKTNNETEDNTSGLYYLALFSFIFASCGIYGCVTKTDVEKIDNRLARMETELHRLNTNTQRNYN